MNYNINEINMYLENFRPCDGTFTEDDVDDFVCSIDINKVPSFDWSTGATKLVIIPEERDYVIKIPFSGEYNHEYEEEEEGYGEFYCDNQYMDYTGAASEYGNDYCEAEEGYYQAALIDGWKDAFLPIEKIGEWHNYPIYIQPKAEMLGDELSQRKYSSEESRKEILSRREGEDKYIFYNLPITWMASMLETYGSFEKVKELEWYLEEQAISDLHCGNIGFYNGHAVIIDYGGWRG